MALDSTQCFIAGTGNVYIAAVGSTAPVDVTTAWAAAWKQVGYTEDDGATFSASYDTDPKTSWQSLDPTNYARTGRTSSVKFTMKQWNQVNFPVVWGGGAIAETGLGTGVYKYDAPSGSTIDYRAIGVEVTDGTKIGRLIIPKALLTDASEVQFGKGEEAVMELTFGVIATGVAAAWTFLGNLALFPVT
jgi:hypothetical protein